MMKKLQLRTRSLLRKLKHSLHRHNPRKPSPRKPSPSKPSLLKLSRRKNSQPRRSQRSRQSRISQPKSKLRNTWQYLQKLNNRTKEVKNNQKPREINQTKRCQKTRRTTKGATEAMREPAAKAHHSSDPSRVHSD